MSDYVLAENLQVGDMVDAEPYMRAFEAEDPAAIRLAAHDYLVVADLVDSEGEAVLVAFETKDGGAQSNPYRIPAGFPFEAASPGSSKPMTVAAIDERYPHQDDLEDAERQVGDAEYVFVEQSRITSDYYLTGHNAPHEAAEYWETQEYRKDWDPIVLIHRPSGTEYTAYLNLTWEEA